MANLFWLRTNYTNSPEFSALFVVWLWGTLYSDENSTDHDRLQGVQTEYARPSQKVCTKGYSPNPPSRSPLAQGSRAARAAGTASHRRVSSPPGSSVQSERSSRHRRPAAILMHVFVFLRNFKKCVIEIH